MLVLSRKTNEKIVFPGSNIVVQVLDIRGGKVRFGIEAPPEVPIMREELLERPQRCRADEHALVVLSSCS
jgi:carbon storage regulator CsrA